MAKWIPISEGTRLTGKKSGSILWAIHTKKIKGRVRYETSQYKHWEVDQASLLSHFGGGMDDVA